MRHFGAIFVGLFLVTLGLGLVMGPENALMLLMILVLCTAGIGLIPLLAVAYLVGRLALALVGHEQPRSAVRLDRETSQRNHAEIDAVATYIRKARTKGDSEQKIEQELVRVGWEGDVIAAAQQVA